MWHSADRSDECDKEPKGYKGNEFVTDALRHSKVKLTWDQDDANRTKLTRRALTREEIEEEDFGNLVAGSDSEDDDADFEDEDEAADEKKKTKKQKMKERKEKLRALLLGGDDDETGDIWGKAGSAWQDELADIKEDKTSKGKKGKKAADDDVEITFRPGLSVAKAAEPETDDMTTLEKYQRRMKEKKAKKKEELELKRAEKEGRDGKKPERKAADDFFGDEDSGDDEPAATKARSPDPEDLGLVDDPTHHFSLKDHLAAEKDAGKKKSRKRNKKTAAREVELGPEGFTVDVADPRFAAMYDTASFALDPTHPK